MYLNNIRIGLIDTNLIAFWKDFYYFNYKYICTLYLFILSFYKHRKQVNSDITIIILFRSSLGITYMEELLLWLLTTLKLTY